MYNGTMKMIEKLIASEVSTMRIQFEEFASLFEAESFLRAGSEYLRSQYLETESFVIRTTKGIREENNMETRRNLKKIADEAALEAKNAIVLAAIARRTEEIFFPEEEEQSGPRRAKQSEIEDLFRREEDE